MIPEPVRLVVLAEPHIVTQQDDPLGTHQHRNVERLESTVRAVVDHLGIERQPLSVRTLYLED